MAILFQFVGFKPPNSDPNLQKVDEAVSTINKYVMQSPPGFFIGGSQPFSQACEDLKLQLSILKNDPDSSKFERALHMLNKIPAIGVPPDKPGEKPDLVNALRRLDFVDRVSQQTGRKDPGLAAVLEPLVNKLSNSAQKAKATL